MQLKLKRIFSSPEYTIGKLSVNGVYLCDVLEDTVRILIDKNKDGDFDDLGEGKIYGKTAIPRGTYDVILTMSTRFKKILPILRNVPGFAGVRIHGGNTIEDTLGCLLLGENKIKGQVINSQKALKKLMDILVKVPKSEKITITVE